MKIPQLFDGFRPDQRDVAGKHQQIAQPADGFTETLHCVPGAQLLRLPDKMHACGSHSALHLLRLVTGDNKNMIGLRDFQDSVEYVLQ